MKGTLLVLRFQLYIEWVWKWGCQVISESGRQGGWADSERPRPSRGRRQWLSKVIPQVPICKVRAFTSPSYVLSRN